MPPVLSAVYRRLLPLPVVGRLARDLAPRVRRWLRPPPPLAVQVLDAHGHALAALRDDADLLLCARADHAAALAALEARVAALEARAAAVPAPDPPA